MGRDFRFIAFDFGAESGRCEVGILGQNSLKLQEVHRFRSPAVEFEGHLHWDVLQMAEELYTGLSQATAEHGAEFDGIGIDTWGVDYVLLDPERRILGYPYHYRDSRTDSIMERTFQRVSREEVYRATGCQFLQFNTLFQLAAEQERSLNLLDSTAHLLMMPNFFSYLLTGNMRTEYTIASTTQLTDPRERDWAKELMNALDLPDKIFPKITEPESLLGTLRPEVAERTGLSPDIPVIAGASHDTAAAVASIPAAGADWAFLSSGTWSLMGMELPKPLITDETLDRNFTNEGGVTGTTRFLKNIMGLWPVQECRRYWEHQGDAVDYTSLEQQARACGSVDAWIDVDDPRFLKPGEMPEKIVNYLEETGQSFREGAGWLTRCVLESLAFKYRFRLREIGDLTGRGIQRLHAVGGGIQNRLLNQLTADATRREVIAGPVEGTAMGNIGVQAVTTGAVKGMQAFRDLVAKSVETVRYQPENPGYWKRNEERYRELVKR